MKKFLKKTLDGFNIVLEEVRDNLPNLKAQQKELSETMSKMKNQMPTIQSQNKDIKKRVEAIVIEQETQRKRIGEQNKIVSSLFEEVSDMEQGFGAAQDTF